MQQTTRAPAGAGIAGAGTAAAPARDWKHRLAHAVKRFLGMFVYLWAILALLLLHEWVVLARYDIPFTRWGFAVVTAFVMAKVMLVMEDLDIPRGFETRPLIYRIVYTSVVFGAVFIAFYVAEETAGGVLRGKTALESIPAIGGGTPQGVLATEVIVALALMPYFAVREIGRAIGAAELHALLFTRGREAAAGGGAAKAAR